MQLLDKRLYFNKDEFKQIEKGGFSIFISDKYFTWLKTSTTGADILNKLDGHKSTLKVIDEISEEYMIPKDIVQNDVVNFCESSLQAKVVYDETVNIEEKKSDDRLKTVYIDVTNECNLKCVYCNKCNIDIENHEKYISSAHVDNILGKLDCMSGQLPLAVNVTGGEPLLNNDLENILINIKKYTNNIVVWTNGTLLNSENIIFLKKYCNYIIISIDDLSEKINDSIRGKGSYAGSLAGASVCLENNMPFIIAVTPLKYNLDNLESMLEFSRDLGAIGMVVNEPIKLDVNNNSLHKHFDYDMDLLNRKYVKLGKKAAIINAWKNNKLKDNIANKQNIAFLCDTERCLNNMFNLNKKASCGAGVNELSIDVFGEIYPCHALQIKSLKLKNIDEFEDRSNLTSFKMLDGCTKCDYNIFCLGGCRASALFNNGDILGKNPSCIHKKEMYDEILWTPMQPKNKSSKKD